MQWSGPNVGCNNYFIRDTWGNYLLPIHFKPSPRCITSCSCSILPHSPTWKEQLRWQYLRTLTLRLDRDTKSSSTTSPWWPIDSPTYFATVGWPSSTASSLLTSVAEKIVQASRLSPLQRKPWHWKQVKMREVFSKCRDECISLQTYYIPCMHSLTLRHSRAQRVYIILLYHLHNFLCRRYFWKNSKAQPAADNHLQFMLQHSTVQHLLSLE